MTPEAKAWEGWGTALKPAHEPIALARKPFRGTVAGCVLVYGTGALNIDGCRVGDGGQGKWASPRGGIWKTDATAVAALEASTVGRWPANVLTDGSLEVLEAFPAAAREAIRFFYAPKADKADREFGLDGFGNAPRANHHPTVKPTDLMAWLCRLVTPPGGVVLDPFTGSGSTGIAAVRHGFRFVGVEQSPEYFEIARRRITAAVEADAAMPRLEREITRATRAVQLSLAGLEPA